jgi:hypothetical protein
MNAGNDTVEFENEVLIPKFNAYCKSHNLPFIITSVDSVQILSLLHQRYDAISGFLKSFGTYHSFNGQAYQIDFFSEVAGMERFTVTIMHPETIVSQLRGLENRIGYLERTLKKKQMLVSFLIVAVVALAALWKLTLSH